MNERKKGFTLTETIVFTAIIATVLLLLVSTSVSTTRQSYISAHKIYATHYAEELGEWLRIQKDLSWQDFYSKSQANLATGPTVYCVNGTILLDTILADMGSYLTDPILDCVFDGINDGLDSTPQIFKRTVSFEEQSDNTKSVKANIIVEWKEAGGAPYSVQTQAIYAPR